MKAVGLLILILTMSAYAQTASPTVAEAQAFMNKAEAQFAELTVKVNRATWVQENFITDDTEAIAANAIDQITAATTGLVEQSKRFDGLTMPADLARKFMLLKLSLTAPAPKDPALRKDDDDRRLTRPDTARANIAAKTGECLTSTPSRRSHARAATP